MTGPERQGSGDVAEELWSAAGSNLLELDYAALRRWPSMAAVVVLSRALSHAIAADDVTDEEGADLLLACAPAAGLTEAHPSAARVRWPVVRES